MMCSAKSKQLPHSFTRYTNWTEKSIDRKSTPLLQVPSRKLSDRRLRFDKLNYSAAANDELQISSRFPKLTSLRDDKKKNRPRVVNLDTTFERKYSSRSDPSVRYVSKRDPRKIIPYGDVSLNSSCERKYRLLSDPSTGERDLCVSRRTFYRDLNIYCALDSSARFKKDMNTSGVHECGRRSFCDTVSSYPCSVVTRSSMSSPVYTDKAEELFVSKCKNVLNWIHSFERTTLDEDT